MTADRWTRMVRQQVGLGRFLPLGGPYDGVWIAERAASGVLRGAAERDVPEVRLDGVRIGLADPGEAAEPAVPAPPSALPPGPLRLTAEFAATAAWPLPETASRLRTALAVTATERIGLDLTEVDLRVTELLDTEPPASRPGTPETRGGTDTSGGADAPGYAATPGYAGTPGDADTPRAARMPGAADTSGATDTARGAGTPEAAGTPKGAGTPRDTDTPGTARMPGVAETSGAADTARGAGKPEAADTPEGADTPGAAGTPRGAGASGAAESEAARAPGSAGVAGVVGGGPEAERVAAAVLRVPGVSRLTGVWGRPVRLGEQAPASGDALPRRHARVDLAVAAGFRPLEVARAVRAAVAEALPDRPTVAVLVTDLD
ncbi:hypothetical protein ACFW5X_19155 [Streptomyces albogriseolus]|uniref:hypothetical protein n=1 Tax=Streptomyces TaxID=1883 RepID=UPI002A762F8F|nr:hypothetical protein [Streptomyces sp. CL7]WPP29083.1 hypothetical protein SJH97_07015 [Streptomyces sp. CL7]